MRVITGEARGRKLKTPANDDVRPTTDNVKESIFNILRDSVEGRKVLDLFAGTGQLGIEAISRGADSVTFTDNDIKSLNLVKENLDLCKFKANVIKTDAVSYLKSCGKFDLIFIDPPYDSNLYEPALNNICDFDILTTGGIIVVESRREKILPTLERPYQLLKEYNYGKVKITTYTRTD